MARPTQNFENHAKMVPLYHYFTFPLLLVGLGWAVYRVATDFSLDRVVILLLVLALIMTAFFARVFALGVQDRVIRLEERLRLAQVLPADLQPRIHEIRTRDLIALRFAPDEELPDLVRRVLAGEFAEPKAIKQAVKNWRADHQRI